MLPLSNIRVNPDKILYVNILLNIGREKETISHHFAQLPSKPNKLKFVPNYFTILRTSPQLFNSTKLSIYSSFQIYHLLTVDRSPYWLPTSLMMHLFYCFRNNNNNVKRHPKHHRDDLSEKQKQRLVSSDFGIVKKRKKTKQKNVNVRKGEMGAEGQVSWRVIVCLS